MTSGIERDGGDPCEGSDYGNATDVHFEAHHPVLTQVVLVDVTDRNNQLVRTQEWQLHGKDAESLALEGNLFAVECPLTKRGKVFVKCAPLPAARAQGQTQVDLTASPVKGGGFLFHLHQTGPDDIETWHVLDYTDGAVGRTRTLHKWQQSLRPQTDVHRIPRFISNSWGDRNRDARINHDFIMTEIDRAARLGVEVVQIDDGWQKGISANSAVSAEKGGVWSGFWAADPEFWTPNPERFPEGLEPLLAYAAKQGVELGLWYAPDSIDAFCNWRKDADQIVALHRRYGVRFFKLDSISAKTLAARRNLRDMLAVIAEESDGNIICDLDITAGVRPGYFGEMRTGPLYLENRYTDWRNYWPHFTLRNLWQLSHWIDPRRLRIEFLNNMRNAAKYEDDPLAPALYPPATLFAITMFANPLGWFENSGLPDDFMKQVAPLVHAWRAHRDAIFGGEITPIGSAPDGGSWTGFCSIDPSRRIGYALLFNEKSPDTQYGFSLPAGFQACETIHGCGEAILDGTTLRVSLTEPFRYLFVRLSADI